MWRGNRADSLQKFAGQLDNAPLDKQLDFLVSELHGDESGAWAAIQSAQGIGAKAARPDSPQLDPAQAPNRRFLM